MTRIRIMCDRTDGTTIKLGDIETDKTGNTIYSANRSLTQDDMYRDTATLAPQTIELIRRLLEAAHRPEPANDPTICAICGAPLTDTTSSICPDCQELEKDW